MILTIDEYKAVISSVGLTDPFDVGWLYRIYVAEQNGNDELAEKLYDDYQFNCYLRATAQLN